MSPLTNWCICLILLGDYTGEDTPVPIPNTVVKLPKADGTMLATAWESRKLPGFFFLPRVAQDDPERTKRVEGRIRSLSPSRPMVLCWQRHGRVGRRRDFLCPVDLA